MIWVALSEIFFPFISILQSFIWALLILYGSSVTVVLICNCNWTAPTAKSQVWCSTKKEHQLKDEEVAEATAMRSASSGFGHPSLRRPTRALAQSRAARQQDDPSVVWLGPHPSSHVAAISTSYQLSDDFQQKQMSMLERKYGGSVRAHRAATIVQRAYREYCLAKKWRQVSNPVRRKLTRIPPAMDLKGRQRFANSAGRNGSAPDVLRPQMGDSEPIYGSIAGLRLHRYMNGRLQPVGAPLSVRVRAIPPAPPNTVQVRVSEVAHSAGAPLWGHPAKRQPPSVKVVSGGRQRSVSAERPMMTRMRVAPSPHKILSQPPEILQSSPVSETNSTSSSDHSGSTDQALDLPSYLTSAQFRQAMESPEARAGRGLCLGDASPTTPTSDPKGSPMHQSPIWIPQPDPLQSSPNNTHLSPRDALDSPLSKSVPDSQNFLVSKRTDLTRNQKTKEIERKRQYRIALNFFNKKPDRGMQFLIDFGFVDNNPRAVAKFLMSRRGLSKQMIGEYLGNLQNPFNGAVLKAFVNEIDLSGQEVDVALRKFQTFFRLPGEAQKIERVIEVFASRYCVCNPERVLQFKQSDTVFVLAFAIIMLNTDLHSPNIKSERRMKLDEFLKNLRGIDDGTDIEAQSLTRIYQRVKEEEFRPGTDHVSQVHKVDKSIIGKKPTLGLPHRRLVCYCRLYEIEEPQKKQSASLHQREIFLFNDMILITKLLNRKKNLATYSYRQSHSLVGLEVTSFRNQYYTHGLKINHTLENKVLFFHARSEDDKVRFLEDLRESIVESDQMEALRIELELEKQSRMRTGASSQLSRNNDSQRDSGLPDLQEESGRMHRALSNSMLELALEPGQEQSRRPDVAASRRRASLNSLDSGMSSTASVESRESSPSAVESRRRALRCPNSLNV